MMRWYGYNITGNMDYNYCMFNYGPSASNGKSTISNIFKSIFTKYVICQVIHLILIQFKQEIKA